MNDQNAKQEPPKATCGVSSGDPFDQVDDDFNDDDSAPSCHECGGSGRVPTMDFESYNGANYKPCPVCMEDPCLDQPPIS